MQLKGRDSGDATAQMEQLNVQDTEQVDANPDASATTSRPKREPGVANSRAAGLSGGGSSSSYRREVCCSFDDEWMNEWVIAFICFYLFSSLLLVFV